MSSAARSILDGDLKLLRFVHHDEENALMSDFCHHRSYATPQL
jgi:hypothetical protein